MKQISKKITHQTLEHDVSLLVPMCSLNDSAHGWELKMHGQDRLAPARPILGKYGLILDMTISVKLWSIDNSKEDTKWQGFYWNTVVNLTWQQVLVGSIIPMILYELRDPKLVVGSPQKVQLELSPNAKWTKMFIERYTYKVI